ncbi:hypothetical protein PTKIN_Ptkin08bG0047100 [Pterospermum kingtungense]
MENNLCEAFNSSILLARYKSIISMLKDIRVRVMERIVEKRVFCTKWKQNYGPLIKDKFDDIKKECVQWEVHWNGEKGCKVKKGRLRYTVDFKKKFCNYRSWQLTGISCPHACCALWNNGKNSDDFVHKWYNPQTFLRAFQHALQPINSPHEWKHSPLDPILPPQPRKMPGRPKKSRRKAKCEPRKKTYKLSSAGMIPTCSICSGEGHNKRGCERRGESKAESSNEMQRDKAKGKAPVHKDKGKQKLRETHTRPLCKKKPTIKGYDTYTNLKTGEQTFYSGGSKGIHITEPTLTSSGSGGSNKRKATTDHAETNEPMKKHKSV